MKFKLLLGTVLFLTPILTYAQDFNFSKIQKGATFKGCYHNPCSVGKVTNFKQLQKSPQQTMLELTIALGRARLES